MHRQSLNAYRGYVVAGRQMAIYGLYCVSITSAYHVSYITVVLFNSSLLREVVIMLKL